MRLHCLLQMCCSFSSPVQLQKTDSEKQARNKKFRIELQGLAKGFGCLRNLVVEIVHHPKVGTRFVKTRVEFEYLFIQAGGGSVIFATGSRSGLLLQ